MRRKEETEEIGLHERKPDDILPDFPLLFSFHDRFERLHWQLERTANF